MKVAINGFGRIGRLVLRALLERQHRPFQIVAINDLTSVSTNALLFEYDSIHGRFGHKVEAINDQLVVDNKPIQVLSESDPTKLPWAKLGIDIVLECSGRFTDADQAQKHLLAGAKKVLISAPAKGVDKTIVYGVNHQSLTPADRLISNASCTTNCLAPVAKILHNTFGIESGYMTTIHAYTGDQRLVDSQHSDPRRARAAAMSMIPTSTGAAIAVGLVLPELKGRLDGTAIRVPAANVSLVDLVFKTQKPANVQHINEAMEHAAQHELKGILAINALPLVSIDFNHRPESSIFDLTQTQSVEGGLLRVLSWYDNEWGFSNRMVDTTAYIVSLT